MSFVDLAILFGIIAIVVHVVGRLVQSNDALVERGRRAIEELADGMRPAEARKPPATRPAARTPAARPRTSPSASAPAGGTRSVPRPAASLDAWYLILDVSPDATRREIHEAMKLRLSRARASRDTEAARRVMRAAAIGIAQAGRRRPDQA